LIYTDALPLPNEKLNGGIRRNITSYLCRSSWFHVLTVVKLHLYCIFSRAFARRSDNEENDASPKEPPIGMKRKYPIKWKGSLLYNIISWWNTVVQLQAIPLSITLQYSFSHQSLASEMSEKRYFLYIQYAALNGGIV